MSPRKNEPFRWAAFFLLCFLVCCVIAMFVATDGILLETHRMVLYVTIALVTGTLFWILTPGATGEVDLKEIGVKLTGGAGIGAGFMVLACWLASTNVTHIVVPIPADIPRDVAITNLTPDSIADVGEVRTVVDRRYIYVEFVPGHDTGRIQVERATVSAGGVTFPKSAYSVFLSGKIGLIRPSESKE